MKYLGGVVNKAKYGERIVWSTLNIDLGLWLKVKSLRNININQYTGDI